MMKKLLLVNPVGQISGTLLSKATMFPPLNLAYVAAVTPPDWGVKIIDENFGPFQFEETDLVGITAFTGNVNRAYQIAQMYRSQGVKVIMGGIHASMLPEEALRFVDSVVVGEVEGVWEQVIKDFEKKRLLPKYVGPQIDLNDYKIKPRRDLLQKNYIWHSVQTSRGCPFNCKFCSVSNYLGRNYRQRHTEHVLDELREITGRNIFFLDDNLIGYSPAEKKRSKGLFEGMIDHGLNKRWWMQTSINIADDPELIRLASRAGCMVAFIGFETISVAHLKKMRKSANLAVGVKNYRKVIDLFHENGIAVLGAFIIGNDNESFSYYKDLSKFLIYSGVDIIQITTLTPLPGTGLMDELQKEGRLVYSEFPSDWDKYRFSYIVHKPRGIDADTIYMGNNYIKHRIYSFPYYQLRLMNSFLKLRNPVNFYSSLRANKAYKKGWMNSHYRNKYPTRFDAPTGRP